MFEKKPNKGLSYRMNAFSGKLKKFLVPVLIVAILAPSLAFVTFPKKAEAIGPVADVMAFLKEYNLDWLAVILARQLVRNLADSIITWIQNGMDGDEPLFVIDLEKALTQTADIAIGLKLNEMLGGPESKFLCSPFRINVVIGLFSYKRTPEFSCTLSAIVDNIEEIFSDFSAGGWPGFLSVSSVNNNALGSILIRFDGMLAAAASQSGAKKDSILLNKGFLVTRCKRYEDFPGFGRQCVEQEQVTPGAAVEAQLTDVLGSDIRQLGVADELNEIIAVFINQVLFAPGGIFGPEETRVPIPELPQQAVRSAFENQKISLTNQVNTALAKEGRYNLGIQAIKAGTTDIIKSNLEILKQCKYGGNNPTIDAEQNNLETNFPLFDELGASNRIITEINDFLDNLRPLQELDPNVRELQNIRSDIRDYLSKFEAIDELIFGIEELATIIEQINDIIAEDEPVDPATLNAVIGKINELVTLIGTSTTPGTLIFLLNNLATSIPAPNLETTLIPELVIEKGKLQAFVLSATGQTVIPVDPLETLIGNILTKITELAQSVQELEDVTLDTSILDRMERVLKKLKKDIALKVLSFNISKVADVITDIDAFIAKIQLARANPDSVLSAAGVDFTGFTASEKERATLRILERDLLDIIRKIRDAGSVDLEFLRAASRVLFGLQAKVHTVNDLLPEWAAFLTNPIATDPTIITVTTTSATTTMAVLNQRIIAEIQDGLSTRRIGVFNACAWNDLESVTVTIPNCTVEFEDPPDACETEEDVLIVVYPSGTPQGFPDITSQLQEPPTPPAIFIGGPGTGAPQINLLEEIRNGVGQLLGVTQAIIDAFIQGVVNALGGILTGGLIPGGGGGGGILGTGIICLAYDTLVLMSDGNYKVIQDIKIGDMIKGIDANGNIVDTPVIDALKDHPRNYSYIVNSELNISNDHPVAVLENNSIVWTRVDKLRVGDKIQSLDGFTEVKSIELSPKLVTTAILETNLGNFIAKGSNGGTYVVMGFYDSLADSLSYLLKNQPLTASHD